MAKVNSADVCKNKILDKLLADIIKEEGICKPTISINVGAAKGDGYVGDKTRIDIKGEVENKPKSLHLIAKMASSSEVLRSQLSLETIYEREIYMYSTIFPLYYAMEKEKGLLTYFFTPKFYKGSMQNKHETLILENMKEAGYRLHERRSPMNNHHVSLVMTEYGRLHALGFALRDQQPEIFNSVQSSMDNHFVKLTEQSNYVTGVVKKCKKAKETLVGYDEKAIQIYEAFVQSIPIIFPKILTHVDHYSTILHGDCWTNNMLFKYEDAVDENKPTKVCFIDFQASRFGSPVLDLSYFLYACSPKDIIDNHTHYLQLYYTSFSAHLQKLGSDPEKLYPYEALKNHWKEFGKYGLFFAVTVVHAMLSENDEVIDLSESVESGRDVKDAFDYDIANVGKYNERIRDIILHLIQNNYI